MKLRNLYLGIKGQMPLKRFLRNIFITGNALGLFSRRSHARDDGTPKVMYNTLTSAQKACDSMSKKSPDAVFRPYKCIFCDGYHIGKNRVIPNL